VEKLKDEILKEMVSTSLFVKSCDMFETLSVENPSRSAEVDISGKTSQRHNKA